MTLIRYTFFETTQNDLRVPHFDFSLEIHVIEALHDLDLMGLGDSVHECRYKEPERCICGVTSPQLMTVLSIVGVEGLVAWSLSVKGIDRPEMRQGRPTS